MDDNNTKDRILKTAVELFLKFGIRSISMDDIAHHLSISKKTIYQHFSDKDEIVTMATRQHLAHERDTLDEIKRDSKNAVDQIIKINIYLRRNLRETTSSMIFELHKYHIKAWTLMEDFKKGFLFETIRQNLHDGIEQGLFRREINADVIAKLRLGEASIAFDDSIFPRDQYNMFEVSDKILEHFILAVTTAKGEKLYQKYKNQMENKRAYNEHDV